MTISVGFWVETSGWMIRKARNLEFGAEDS